VVKSFPGNTFDDEYGTPPADVKGFPKFTTQISILAFVPPSKVASPWDALALPPGWRCNKNHDHHHHGFYRLTR